MSFDVEGALKAGYSRSEVADYLASQRNFDAAAARKAGYSDDEILSHLSGSARVKDEPKAPAVAPEPPASAEPIDYSAAATAMQGESAAAPAQEGLLSRIGKALRPGYRSVMEDYQPTPEEIQANRDQRLSYGAGPIRSETAATADLVRSGMAQSEDPTVNRVAQTMQERGDPGIADLMERVKRSDPDRFQEAAQRDRRRQFAEDNPLLGSLAAGSAGMVSGMANIPNVAADAFNQTFVNPVLQAVGLRPLARVANAFGTEYLAKAAEDYMPKVGKQEMGTAWKRDEFAPWLMSKLAANSPQIAQSLMAAFVPPLRAVLLPGMAGTAAGQSFAAGDDSRVAVTKGAIEYATEKLPLGVFDKIGDSLRGMSVAKQNAVMAVAGQRLLQSGAAVTANTLTNAIEETAAQLGGNVLDKYFQGKDIELSQGLAEAAVVGGATGKLMSAPQVAAAATGYYEPEKQIAREIDRNVANTQFTQPADQVARTLLSPDSVDPRMVSPELTVDPTKIRAQVTQARTVDEAVAAAEAAAGTVAVDIPAPLTVPQPPMAAPVAPTLPGVSPAVEQQFGFDKLRLNAPRPQRIQGAPVSQLTDEQLEQIAGNEAIPAITRRGASVELAARRSGATMEAGRVEPTLNLQSPAAVPAAEQSANGQRRVEPTLNIPAAQPAVPGVSADGGAAQPESFVAVPEQPGMRDVPAAPVGGADAAQRARETAQRSLDAYSARTGQPVMAQFNPAPPELDAAVNEIAQAVNSQFAGRVYAYSDPRPEAVNGLAVGKMAFVNTANVEVNAARTSLHEFKHTVEQIAKAEARAGQTGTAAQKFVAEIDSIYDDMSDAGKRAYLENFLAKDELAGITDQAAREARIQELMADPLTRSEMTADFLGNRATDKKFWQEVAKADPEGFRGFVEKWLQIIDNLLAQLRGTKTQGRKESARVDKYVADLNKAKMVAREALVAYSKAVRGYDSGAYEGAANATVSQSRRDQDVPADAAENGRGAGEDGGSEVPSYGTARKGAVSVIGRHYSPEPRQALNGGFYGRGLKGAERDRLDSSPDPRLRSRVYFYVDNGQGVRPEAGVGGYAHEVRLENLYDPASKLIAPQSDSNAFESAVINAGFDGYLIRNFTTSQGAAVLLGNKHKAVPVKPLGQVVSAAATTVAAPATLRKGLLSREADAVDVSRIPGARLRMGNLEVPAESRDAANVELERIGSDARFSQREYKLDLEREERAKGKAATVTPEEQAAVMRDAAANKVPEKQVRELLKTARDVKKQYPASAGWAPLKLAGLEVKTDEDTGEQSVDLKWQAIGYGYNKAPGVARAPAKMDEAWAGKVADSFYKLIKDIYARADKGDKNAQIIVGHQTWYRNVAEVLRREYGAQGDLLADLLGATSPNTPVDTNWKFSVDILRRFMKGDFNNDLAKFDDYVKAGGVVSKYPAADKIRQVSGKLYGMNSSNAMKALLDMWRVIEPGSAPKARNFALNLIGQSNMATIDVWAARMLRRAADLVRGANLPRIPPPAEQGVSGNWNADSTKVTGEFGFGAKVMDLVSEKLAAEGISVTPPDLQAIAWFAEKELWGKNRWTTVTGEGGSFEENIEAMPVERYLAGWSIQQGERVPRSDQVSTAQARVMSMLVGDDSVVTARVMPTKGLYGGTVEESFDTEWTVDKGKHDPSLVMAEIAKIAGENEQYDIFVSRVLAPSEYSANARPGVEIYFRSKRALEQAMPVLERFTSRGQDGFTMAVDPRAKAAGEFIGVRLQYVPEISIRWDSDLRARLLKEGELESELAAKTKLLDEIAAEVSTMEGVAFARAQQYDTVVVGKENYDEYIGRGASGPDQGTGSQVWFGQPVREAVERAAARVAGDQGPVDEGRVPDVGSTETEPEVTPPEAPAPSTRQRTADEIPREELAGRRVKLPVLIEDTGQTATITLDAKDALDEVDERESAMQRLLECLRK